MPGDGGIKLIIAKQRNGPIGDRSDLCAALHPLPELSALGLPYEPASVSSGVSAPLAGVCATLHRAVRTGPAGSESYPEIESIRVGLMASSRSAISMSPVTSSCVPEWITVRRWWTSRASLYRTGYFEFVEVGVEDAGEGQIEVNKFV